MKYPSRFLASMAWIIACFIASPGQVTSVPGHEVVIMMPVDASFKK